MKIYAPSYYKDFVCIADRCRHSCCIGWEIDIDVDTYTYYQSVGGAFGERLQKSVIKDTQGAHFCLDNAERCPFLNANGLCDIFIKLGENALCQICTDHPRFRNFYKDRIEIGLGLCCEAAAELILNFKKKVTDIRIEENGAKVQMDATEQSFFAFRARVLSVVQEREKPFFERIQNLISLFGLQEKKFDLDAWRRIYLKLERLDTAWTRVLENAPQTDYAPTDMQKEQLFCYFVYRHLADGIYDGSLLSRLQFCLHATDFICALSADAASFLEVARMYSAEIEYSKENIEKLLSRM